MRKTLVTVALALVIVGSMLAGTLAQYVKVSDQGNLNPQFKEFNFTAAKADNFNVSLKMAPGESQSWNFLVSNAEGGVVSETAMLVSIKLTPANLPAGMLLLVNGAPYVNGAVVSAFAAGTEATNPITIKAIWNSVSDSNDTSFEGYTQGTIGVSFTATQAADFQIPADFIVNTDGSNRVNVQFMLPDAVNLADANSNITVEYFRIVSGKKVYVNTSSGNPLIKSKTWGGYLNNLATGEKYSKGSDSPTLPDLIPAGTLLGTTVDPRYATMNYVDGSWVSAGSGPLYVTVTVNDAGKVYQATGSIGG